MLYNEVKMIPQRRSNVRFALSKHGDNTLIVVGFNPSTADEITPDRTMQSVMRLCNSNGYDGFVMLNLYPLRSKSPDELPEVCDEELHRRNFRVIIDMLDEYGQADVLLAFGDLVYKRQYTLNSAKELLNILNRKNRRTLCIDILQSGMPRHPLYARSDSRLKPFTLSL